jgi:hypothetical protein
VSEIVGDTARHDQTKRLCYPGVTPFRSDWSHHHLSGYPYDKSWGLDGAGTHRHFDRKGKSKRTARRDSGWWPARLYLVIQPSGAKSWAYRYRLNGKTRKYTIGAFPKVDLVNARKLARDTPDPYTPPSH